MKHTISFNLPDEKNELLMAERGGDYFSILWEISKELRNWTKYDKKPKDTLEAISQLIQDAPIWDIE
jgi:hypothetical protein